MDTETSNLSTTSVIIGSQFCDPNPQQLVFSEKLKAPWTKRKLLGAIDVNGKIIFTTRSPVLSVKHRSVLIDAATGNALVSIQKKIIDPHGIWEVYAGKSYAAKDLFTVERTSSFQLKTQLNVFLATNVTKETCDFRIKGCCNKKTCKVYKGNSSNIVAQARSSYIKNQRLLRTASYLDFSTYACLKILSLFIVIVIGSYVSAIIMRELFN